MYCKDRDCIGRIDSWVCVLGGEGYSVIGGVHDYGKTCSRAASYGSRGAMSLLHLEFHQELLSMSQNLGRELFAGACLDIFTLCP